MSNINFTSANVVVLGSSKNINRISDFVHGANGKNYVAVRDENDVETRCAIASMTKTLNSESSRLSMTVTSDNLSLMTSFLTEMTDMFSTCKFYIEFNDYDETITYYSASRRPMHPASEIIVIDCKSNNVFKFSESNSYRHYMLAIDVINENINTEKKKSAKEPNPDRKSAGESMISRLTYKLNCTYVNAFYDEIHSMPVIDNPDTTLTDALNSVLSA